MAKRCPEEFNPWPPFVDIFASVILVMLLFLLITIVNIGYYAQFKYKISYTASVETKIPIQPEEQTKAPANANKDKKEECKKTPISPIVDDEKAVSFHKIVKPSFENANNSFFEGGKEQGNAVNYSDKSKKYKKQKIIKKHQQITVAFQDNEIFVTNSIKRKIKLFVGSLTRKSKRVKFKIYASDPKNIMSMTIAKQISLGRVLNIKNIIKQSNVKNKNISMNLQNEFQSSNPYGEVIIKAEIP